MDNKTGKETPELKFVPLKDLFPSELNTYEADDIDVIKDSLLMHGLISPLTVCGPYEASRYEIIAGVRRYKAAKELNDAGIEGYEKLPVYIKAGADLSQLEKKLYIEASNLDAHDASDKNRSRMNIMRILKEMSEEGKIQHHHIVRESGKYMQGSKRYRRMFLSVVDDGIGELQNLLQDHKIAAALASEVSCMEKEVQEEIIYEISKGNRPGDVIDKWKGKTEKERSEVLETVSRWCEYILCKDNYTEEEYKVIELCRQVAEKIC